jgi:ADP-ribosylglycohydrolase
VPVVPQPNVFPDYNGEPDPANMEDRAWGMIFGAAIGSAVGLPCQSASPETLTQRYNSNGNNPRRLGYPHPDSSGYIHEHPVNDWGAEIDEMVVLMRAYKQTARDDTKLAELIQAHAAQLTFWARHGFKELGDTFGVGCDATVSFLVEEQDFVDNPYAVADQARVVKTSCAPLFRAIAYALHPDQVNLARVACRLTHSDASASACCSYVSRLLHLLLLGFRPSGEMVREPVSAAQQLIPESHSMWKTMMSALGGTAAWLPPKALQPNHVFRGLNAAMHAYKSLIGVLKRQDATPDQFFRKIIMEVAMGGGNASAHCAMAGAVIGAVVGYTRLPADWLEALPNGDWLSQEFGEYLDALGVPRDEQQE